MPTSRISLLFTTCLAACTSGAPEPTSPEAAEPAAPATAEPAVPSEGVYRTQECRDLLTRYREVLAAGERTCDADSDCQRYGGVDPDDVCGGVTDRQTAQALTDVRAQMDAAQCMALPYSCPAYAGECVDGTCQVHEGARVESERLSEK